MLLMDYCVCIDWGGGGWGGGTVVCSVVCIGMSRCVFINVSIDTILEGGLNLLCESSGRCDLCLYVSV